MSASKNATGAVFQADKTGRITHWSPGAKDATGIESDDAVGKRWGDLLDARDSKGRRLGAIITSGAVVGRGANDRSVSVVQLFAIVPATKSTTAPAVKLPESAERAIKASAGRQTGRAGKLSPREIEVLRLLAEGHSTYKVGDRLFISPTTVRNHVQSILRKLAVHSKLEAVVLAYRSKLF